MQSIEKTAPDGNRERLRNEVLVKVGHVLDDEVFEHCVKIYDRLKVTCDMGDTTDAEYISFLYRELLIIKG